MHAVAPRLTSDGSSSVAATSPDPTLCDAKTGGEPGIDRRLLLPLLNHAGITPSTVHRFPLPIFVYLRNGKDWGVESRAANYLRRNRHFKMQSANTLENLENPCEMRPVSLTKNQIGSGELNEAQLQDLAW
ncbi:hypothetical protein EJB05_12134, partial [Eragrostis curvula]